MGILYIVRLYQMDKLNILRNALICFLAKTKIRLIALTHNPPVIIALFLCD